MQTLDIRKHDRHDSCSNSTWNGREPARSGNWSPQKRPWENAWSGKRQLKTLLFREAMFLSICKLKFIAIWPISLYMWSKPSAGSPLISSLRSLKIFAHLCLLSRKHQFTSWACMSSLGFNNIKSLLKCIWLFTKLFFSWTLCHSGWQRTWLSEDIRSMEAAA